MAHLSDPSCAFSIIIPIRISHSIFEVYLENLKYCLQSARKIIEAKTHTGEIVLSDYGSIAPYNEQISALASAYGCRYTYQHAKFWSRSAALNCGIAVSTGQRIFIIDSDTVVPENYISVHLEKAHVTNYTVNRVFDSDASAEKSASTERLYKQPGRLRAVGWSHISVDRAWLIKHRGYDENYRCWGGEDDDLNLRMELSGLRQQRIPLKPVHLYHLPYGELMKRIGRDEYFKAHKQANKQRYWMYRNEVEANGLWNPHD